MTITIDIDGTEVVGEILLRTASDLMVEIVEPYTDLTTSLHIMTLARQPHGRHDGFLGEYGIQRAEQMLRALYEAGKAIHEDASIVDLFKPYYERARQIEMTHEEYRQRRLELRQRLRNHEIDNNRHSLLAKDLREEQGRRNFEADKVRDEFVDAHVPSARCITIRDRVWEVLTGLRERGI